MMLTVLLGNSSKFLQNFLSSPKFSHLEVLYSVAQVAVRNFCADRIQNLGKQKLNLYCLLYHTSLPICCLLNSHKTQRVGCGASRCNLLFGFSSLLYGFSEITHSKSTAIDNFADGRASIYFCKLNTPHRIRN